MTHLRMSLKNATLTAFFLVLYVTGETETAESYAEHVAYGLADVAHIRQLESQFRSSDSPWYCDGMDIFAYNKPSDHYWIKRELTWTLANEPVVMTRQAVISAMDAACRKWAAVSPFTFKQIPAGQRVDIKITFVPRSSIEYATAVGVHPDVMINDRYGVSIKVAKIPEWTDTNPNNYVNLRFILLYDLGLCLGVGNSKVPGAVMNHYGGLHIAMRSTQDYALTQDDIRQIQAKYGPRPSSGSTPGPHPGTLQSPSISGPPISSRFTTGPYRGRQVVSSSSSASSGSDTTSSSAYSSTSTNSSTSSSSSSSSTDDDNDNLSEVQHKTV